MKKIAVLLGLVGVFSIVSLAQADVTVTTTTYSDQMMYTSLVAEKVYTNSSDFLWAEGATCQVATDGCNTIMINDGKLGASTMMYCANIYEGTQQWSCTKRVGQLNAAEQVQYQDAWTRAGIAGQDAVRAFMIQFKIRAGNMVTSNADAFKWAVLGRVDNAINFLFNNYSEQAVMSSRVYSVLKLVKFELGLLK